jgi:hypothetical protein
VKEIEKLSGSSPSKRLSWRRLQPARQLAAWLAAAQYVQLAAYYLAKENWLPWLQRCSVNKRIFRRLAH